MAARKKPQTDPVIDTDAKDDAGPVVKELPLNQFRTALRGIHNADRDALGPLRDATFTNLRRLRTRRDKSKAVNRRPRRGSDQADQGSLITWMSKIGRKDAAAIDQLLAIDATIVARMGG
jgi:hypothetical protein